MKWSFLGVIRSFILTLKYVKKVASFAGDSLGSMGTRMKGFVIIYGIYYALWL